MTTSYQPGSVARIARQSILRILVSFPIACFCGALVTDIAYVSTANMLWADFSAWLLATGMLMGVLAAIVGVVDMVVDRRRVAARSIWPVLLGGLVILLLALIDNFVHSRDAWTSVMPTGLALSAATVVAILLTMWFDTAMMLRNRIVTPYAEKQV